MKYADLIAKLTLEEKAGLTSGRDFWHTKAVERLGIPSEMMTDGPHGLRKQESDSDALGLGRSVPATCFPTASALANSWDKRCSLPLDARSVRRLWRRASAWCSGRA